MRDFNIPVKAFRFISMFALLLSTANLLIAQTESEKPSIPIYTFDEFNHYLSKDDGKIYIINFWATWCAPCVAELPYFERIGQEYKDKNVHVVLVSLDFPRQYETRLIPFVEERQLKSEVLMLNDPDANAWIPKVSNRWSGAIPATLFYNSALREFHEKQFNYEELVEIVSKFL